MKKKIFTGILAAAIALTMTVTPLYGGNAEAAGKSASEGTVKTAEGLSAKSAGYNSIKLAWRSGGSDAYYVFRASSSGGRYKLVKTLSSGELNYTDKNLVTEKRYYYKVAGSNSRKRAEAALAKLDNVYSEPKLSKPKANVKAESRTTVRISWKKTSGATGYVIRKYDSKKAKYVNIKTLGSGIRNYSQKKQTPNTAYKYKVRAVRESVSKACYTDSSALKIRTPKKLTMNTAGFWKTNPGKVIQTARTKLGCAYVWGASGPNVFDCSGFTCWTMQNAKLENNSPAAGINIPRYSSSGLHYNYNKAYGLGRNLDIAQPGDIIIIGRGGSASSIFHVGIFYNNGQYIHANGTKVVISKIPAASVVSIIRLPGLDI